MDTRIARDSDLSLTSNPSARRPTVTAAPLCVAHINRAPSLCTVFSAHTMSKTNSFSLLGHHREARGVFFFYDSKLTSAYAPIAGTPFRRVDQGKPSGRQDHLPSWFGLAERDAQRLHHSDGRYVPFNLALPNRFPFWPCVSPTFFFFHLCMNEIFTVIVVTLTRYNLTPLLLHSNGHHPPCHTVTRSYRMVAQAHKQGR